MGKQLQDNKKLGFCDSFFLSLFIDIFLYIKMKYTHISCLCDSFEKLDINSYSSSTKKEKIQSFTTINNVQPTNDDG